jgi:uncharacterized membrane protein
MTKPIHPLPSSGPEAHASRPLMSPGARLRNYFLTGLIVAGPVAITIYLSWWFIQLIDGWVKPFVPVAYLPETYLPFTIPGFGLIIGLIGLTLVGFLTANLVGRSLLDFGEAMLDRMPFVRGIYKGVKQIFETVFKQDGHSFRKVGLIEWPGEGLWSLCFITVPAEGTLAAQLPPGDHVCVFVPCTPNPTTGYLVIMERSRVKEIDVTTDEAFKLLMSMGIIQPAERPPPLPGVPLLTGQPPAAPRPMPEIINV